MAAIETAVILAAGRGTRLAGEVSDRPKGFLAVGDRPIIEESIARLQATGVRQVVIVTGHLADHYEALAARLAPLVTTVHNPEYAGSGSMYSLYCARSRVTGDFLLLESDLVYEPRALAVLQAWPAPDAILLSGPTGAGDEVYVETDAAGCLVNMSKRRRDLASVAGELTGLSRISASLFARMQAIAARAFATSLRYDYESDCLVAAAREQAIPCPVVPDLVWGEIDDPAHLRRVREQVYPLITGPGMIP